MSKKQILIVVALLIAIGGFYFFQNMKEQGGTPFAESDSRQGESQGTGDDEPFKVGFVYVGPVGDHGWSYRHDVGRLEVEAKFGDRVKTTFVEKVGEGADAERVIRNLVADGNKLIFTTSFGFMDQTLKVAKDFPEVAFEHASGYKTAKNMGIYNARFYEGRYPAGVLAGRMTQSNVIGYVASFPIPEVIMGINAMTLGARSVNPEVEVRVIWVSSWYDPPTEADAAKTLINQGADVIFQHTDSPSPLQISEEMGVWGVGQASDMARFAPKAQLTSIVNSWGPHYIESIQAAMEGNWKPGNYWRGLKEGWVTLSPLNQNVPPEIQEEFAGVVERIKAGTLHPFQGPIKKQDGSVLVEAGQTLSDQDLLSMNAYVQGVAGEIPQ